MEMTLDCGAHVLCMALSLDRDALSLIGSFSSVSDYLPFVLTGFAVSGILFFVFSFCSMQE